MESPIKNEANTSTNEKEIKESPVDVDHVEGVKVEDEPSVDLDAEVSFERKKKEEENKALIEELKVELERFINIKKEANAIFKSKLFSEASEKYDSGFVQIEEVLSKYENKHFNNAEINDLITKIKAERVFLLSNKAMCLHNQGNFKDCFNVDMEIINKYDPNWDKSYGRIITSCLRQNNLMLANQYAAIFQMKFNPTTLEKYEPIFRELEEENQKIKQTQKKDADVFSENTTLKSSIIKDAQTVKKKKTQGGKFKWIFGGFLLFSSAIGLIFLFSNRKKFLK